MAKILKLVGAMAANCAGIAWGGREYKVIDGIVQCTDAEAEAMKDDVASHGFRFEITEGSVRPPVQTPVPAGAQITGSTVAEKDGKTFSIKDGDVVIAEGLSKADADAFNAKTDEEKAAHIANLRAKREGAPGPTGPSDPVVQPQVVPEAVKKGKKWQIVRGEAVVVEDITEAQATEFNALRSEEREDMLKKTLAAGLAS